MKPAPSRFEVSIGLSRAGLEVSVSERWLAPGIRLEGLVGHIATRPTRISSQDLEAHLYQSRLRATQVAVEVERGTLQRAALAALGETILPTAGEPGRATGWSVREVLLMPRFPDQDSGDTPCLALVGTSQDGTPVSLWVGLDAQTRGRHLEVSPGRLWATGLSQEDARVGLQAVATHFCASAFFALGRDGSFVRIDPGASLLIPAWLAMGWQVLDLAATHLWPVVVDERVIRFELRAQAPPQGVRPTTQQTDPVGETLARVVCLASGDEDACKIGLRALAEVREQIDHRLFVDTIEAWSVQIAQVVGAQARREALERWCEHSPARTTARCLDLGAAAASGVAAQVDALRRGRALPGTHVQQVLRELAWGMSLLLHAGDAKAARRVLEPVAHTLLRDTPTGWLTGMAWGAVVRARAEDEDVVCEGVLQALVCAQASCDLSMSGELDALVSWIGWGSEAASARWSARQVEDVRGILGLLCQDAPQNRDNVWVRGLAQADQGMLAHLAQEPSGTHRVRYFCALAWLVKLQGQRQQDPGNRGLLQQEASCRAALRVLLGAELGPSDLVEEASILGFGLGRTQHALDLLGAGQSRWPGHRGLHDTLDDLRSSANSTG